MQIERRIADLRKYFDGRTQAVRGSLIAQLEELQRWAAQRAKAVRNEKFKQKWVQVAAYLAQTITYVAGEFDAAKIDVRLDELERLVRELKQTKKN